jgi:alpha-N-arabinofuranosidase
MRCIIALRRAGKAALFLIAAAAGVPLWAVLSPPRLVAQEAGPIRIEIDASKRASYAIPRTIFGSFLEPIGNSTYNGLWAEILQNPSFEENLWNANSIVRMLRDQPALARASELGLPLPWEPLDAKQGNRYEPRWNDAANSSRSLAILGLPDKETGVKQRVYVPVPRALRYTGSIYLKALAGAMRVDISLRKRNEMSDLLAHAGVDAPAGDWKKREFTLEIQPNQVQPLEAVDFVIAVRGGQRVLVDQVSLMPADAIEGLDPDMVRMAREMKTPLMRFGGNYTSAYHWRDGIGPRDKRVNMLNIAWGIPEYNQFGTDEFLRFCELIGAEPQIALNLGSGTPDEAAGWVRYVDEHLHRHGLLWELGNELWGNWNLGYPTLQELPRRTAEFSSAVHKADPKARLIATGQDPDHYSKWNAAQLSDPAGTFHFLSTHFVVGTDEVENRAASPDEIARAAFALPVELGRRVRDMQGQIDASPNFTHTAHVAFTEWLWVCCDDAPHANAPRFDNMGGAVVTGGFFNMLLQNANVVPVSDMTGIIEFAGIWKKRGRVYAAPAYYVFRLYSTADIETPVAVRNEAPVYDVHRGVSRLPEIAHVPVLEVTAAVNHAADRLTLFCVNRNLDADTPAALHFAGFDGSGSAAVQSVTANSIYDTNSEEHPETVIPARSSVAVAGSDLQYTFRRASVTRIELSRH